MFILTNQTIEKWIFQTVFDTATGLRYKISINKHPVQKFCHSVQVNVESAHVAASEDQYLGLSYYNKEAVDFWYQFGKSLPLLKEDSDTFEWILFEAGEALARPEEVIVVPLPEPIPAKLDLPY